PINHPIANKSFVTLDILKKVPAILLPNTYFIRQLIDEMCKSLNFTPKPVIEITTMKSIINIVSNSDDITILHKEYLNYINNSKIQIILLKDQVITTEIGIVYRKNKYLCAASSVFIDQLVTKIKKAELPD